ncbi:gephyrin-like molybdotransferase Glp [Lacticaseibacillus baoqingensis]|uniref:Molybdopterin molybdenumtransferase n=1 Tax=Lacticaseibacillus baoqingensis TaxID=2486013 RepID=A0ABW4EB99_9LACO|nr:gephyrin-like molybdotransferase Glp [Lacticaseibacillus baoqingensis]
MYTPVDHRNALAIATAQTRLAAQTAKMPRHTEKIPVTQALGRVLAEPVTAPYALPTFRRAGYDGYAVNHQDLTHLPATLQLVGEIPAGADFPHRLQLGQAVRIMTGGFVPEGADVVVMLETTTQAPQAKTVTISERQKNDNITPVGSFFAAGAELFPQGATINPGGLSLLASFNIQTVTVAALPKVGIITTGSELLRPDQPLANGKIYDSNGPLIQGLCVESGVDLIGVKTVADDPQALQAAVAELLPACDILITDGGVSVGDFDIIADYAKHADTLLFNKLEMRPGSVTTAYMHENTLCFGLSGNPGACFTGFYLFVEPTLRQLQGAASRLIKTTGRLDHTYTKTNMYDRILRGTYQVSADGLVISRTGSDASDNLNNLHEATCLFEIPRGTTPTKAGEVLTTWLLPYR